MSTLKAKIDDSIVDEFLRRVYSECSNVEIIHGGELSQAFSFIGDGEALIIRINASDTGFLKDDYAYRNSASDTLLEARILTALWMREYNRIRPHSSLDYRPPAPEVYEPMFLEPVTITLEVVQ